MQSAVLLFALIFVAAVSAQFSVTSVGGIAAGTFANGNAGYIRAYNLNTIGGRAFVATGFRAVGGIANNTAGLAADATLVGSSTWFDCVVAMAYFAVEGSAKWDNSSGNWTANWSAAGIGGGIRFFKLLEYNETNNVDGFQPGVDKVIGYYLLHIAPWGNFVYNKNTVGDVTYYSASAQTTDGVFGFRISGSGNYTKMGNYKIDPTSIKLDVLIKYYNNPNYNGFALHASGPSDATKYPNARIAVVAGLGAFAGAAGGGGTGTVSSITGDSPNNNGASIKAYAAAAGAKKVFWTHNTTADWSADGVTWAAGGSGVVVVGTDNDPTANSTFGNDVATQVNAGNYAAWKAWGAKSLQWFSYTSAVRPSKIEWDPSIEMEVDSGTPNTTSSSASTVSAALFAVIALIALVLAM